MFNTLLALFKNPYQDLAVVAQIMQAVMTTFATDKFVNGESDRDAAIDAIIAQLQSHKSTAVAK